jgi:hypothetical protein
VRDEQVREAELLLEPLEQVQNLRLDRDVERGRSPRRRRSGAAPRERARDADALALSARELVRVAPHRARIELHALEQRGDALGALAVVAPIANVSMPSATASRTRMRGSSEASGSWNTIWIARR